MFAVAGESSQQLMGMHPSPTTIVHTCLAHTANSRVHFFRTATAAQEG